MTDMAMAEESNLSEFWKRDTVKEILKNADIRRYLTIVNPNPSEVSFCIQSSESLPSPDSFIQVSAHYGDTEV